MKKVTIKMLPLIVALFVSAAGFSQTSSVNADSNKSIRTSGMKMYLIERDIPGAGNLTGTDLKGISQKSCTVLKELGPGIEWVQSFVTADKIYCVYRAENEALLRTHAEKGGFPINSVTIVSTTISPATAEMASVK